MSVWAMIFWFWAIVAALPPSEPPPTVLLFIAVGFLAQIDARLCK